MSWSVRSVLFVAGLGGCASTELARVDENLLTSLPQERREEMERRASTFEDARASEEEARKKLAAARLGLEAAELALEGSEFELEANEALTRRATKLGLDGEVRTLEASRSTLKLLFDEAKSRAGKARAQVRHAERRLSLRAAERHLADTLEEESKAMAAHASGVSVAQSISLVAFKDQVADARDRVAAAHDREARAFSKLEAAGEAHDQAVARLPDSSDDTRKLMRARRDRERLEQRLGLLQKRVRALERKNDRLTARVIPTSTTASR